jgi:hypothetical protein
LGVDEVWRRPVLWVFFALAGAEFKIGGVYDDGWKWWVTTPSKHHEFTPIKKIFACKDKDCVKDVIGSLQKGWLFRGISSNIPVFAIGEGRASYL